MTNREAIVKLKESVNYYDTECPEDKVSKFAWKRMQELTEVYQLAIAALEKQEPEEPEDKWTEGSSSPFITKHRAGRCPVCGQGARDYMKFCHHCGQALNWEDTE